MIRVPVRWLLPAVLVAAPAWAERADDAPVAVGDVPASPELIVGIIDTGGVTRREVRAHGTRPDVRNLSGRQLMEAIYERHEAYPFVYEEQSMVLVDRQEARDTRRLRRYSRLDDDGTLRILLVFDSPAEVEGVALLAAMRDGETLDMGVYLPALGGELVRSDPDASGNGFLGTDFSIENIAGENLDEYRYVRRRSRLVDGVDHHVVDVFDPADDVTTARALRRHFVRADNLFITRTDHLDDLGRRRKRQTVHDLRPVDGDMWRGDLLVVEDLRERHRTLLRVDRRVFSRDYVPAEIFDLDWLLRNRPPLEPPSDETGGAAEEIIVRESFES